MAAARVSGLDLEPIKAARKAVLDNPPIRWGRGDVVPLVERDIELLIAEVERLRVRDKHADECIEARNKRLSEMAVECDRLRAALVGLIGVDGKDDLEQMEGVMRLMPGIDEDKIASVNAIHALLATLPLSVGERAAGPQEQRD